MFASATKWLQLGSVALGSVMSLLPQEVVVPDFRSVKEPMIIEINRASPAFAALEDIRHNYGFENKSAFYRLPQVTPLELEVLETGDPFEQRMVAEANEKIRPLQGLVVEVAEEIRAPTLQETATMLVEEELKRRELETPDKKIIPSQLGSSIVVARVERTQSVQSPRRNLFMPSRNLQLPEGRTLTRKTNRGSTKNRNEKTSSQRTVAKNNSDLLKPPSPEMSFMSAGEPSYSEQELVGVIRFTGGVAYAPGNDQIDIYQEIDGAAVSLGQFHFNKGYFSLKVMDLIGRIVADLRNRDGELMGRGEILLNGIQSGQLADLTLRIGPLFDGLKGQVLAGASSFKTLPPVEEARLFIDGMNREVVLENKNMVFIDKGLRPGSRVQLRAEAPDHWGSLFFADAGRPFEGRLYTNKIANALLDLASPNKFVANSNQEKAVIWGRVLINGRPLANATVELPFDKNQKATYFTGFLPDRKRVVTSENGEFVFVGVEEGIQIVRVRLGDHQFAPIFVETAARHVSAVDYEIQPPKMVVQSAHLAFSDQGRPAFMRIVGEESIYEISKGETEIEMQQTRGLTMAEFDGGEEFRLTRLMLNGHESEISAPLFKNEWADAFGSRLLVGRVDGEDFEVLPDTRAIHSDVKIVYLDSNGEPTSAQSGEAGGGFVVSGLPQGLHTIAIIPAKSKKVLTQIVYVDEHAIHYIKKSIF